jgi:hypothetical protein
VTADEQIRDTRAAFAGTPVALVAYTVREQMTVDGKPLTLEAADAST